MCHLDRRRRLNSFCGLRIDGRAERNQTGRIEQVNKVQLQVQCMSGKIQQKEILPRTFKIRSFAKRRQSLSLSSMQCVFIRV